MWSYTAPYPTMCLVQQGAECPQQPCKSISRIKNRIRSHINGQKTSVCLSSSQLGCFCSDSEVITDMNDSLHQSKNEREVLATLWNVVSTRGSQEKIKNLICGSERSWYNLWIDQARGYMFHSLRNVVSLCNIQGRQHNGAYMHGNSTNILLKSLGERFPFY